MKSLPAAFAAVALLSLACAQAPAEKPAEKPPEKPAVDVAAETTALRAAAKAFNESATDLEKRMSFFADDAVRLGPGQGALVGKTAIQARAAELKALPGFTVEAETTTAEVAASGDLGYTFGSGQVSIQSGDKVVTLPGHSLTVWKKQAGAWKIVADAVSATPGAETTK
jgi:ketosteroid isomerase-like protein